MYKYLHMYVYINCELLNKHVQNRCKLQMWLICKGTHCFEISIRKILFFFSIESAEQYIQAQAHTELMTKAGRWPALAEPTPPRRRHVPRLTHGVARNHQSHESVCVWAFGGTYESWQREKEGERAAGDKDRGQAVSGQAYISSTQSVAVTVGLSAALKSAWTWNKPKTDTAAAAAAAASGWHTFTVLVVKHTDSSRPHCQRPPTLRSRKNAYYPAVNVKLGRNIPADFWSNENKIRLDPCPIFGKTWRLPGQSVSRLFP